MNAEFHIHVDAWILSSEFSHRLLKEWHFAASDFAGHPADQEGFEPPHHLTFKTRHGAEFRTVFHSVVAAAQTDGSLKGYIEGEFLPFDEDIPQQPFNPGVSPPI